MIRAFVSSLALAACVASAQPVRLAATPQKFRTFYSLDDSAVPATLKQTVPPHPVAIDAMCVAADGAVWYGARQGVVRYQPRAAPRDRVQYFAGKRYLPDDEVLHIVADSSAGVWVRTKSGVSHIELRPMTLAAKAEIFEQRIRERHDRWGMVSPSILQIPGGVKSNRMRDDDNDGLWTAIYAAAECFRYAVTKSPEALARATKSIEAILFLEEVAGKRGFPARSYLKKGEPPPRDGEWHWSPDGQYYWKADTSSDEIVGHFFIFGIASDLLPPSPLNQRIRETAARIMDHIIANNYYLIDLDGKPTRWGKWNMEYLRAAAGDGPLNALELLSFLKTAAHVTGDAKYEKEYRKAAIDLGYAAMTARLKELRDELNYSDEELAFLPFYLLFRYEKDSELLNRYYRPAMDQWWENASREDNPLWTFIYLTGRPEKGSDRTLLEGAARTLYRSPIDAISWTVKNSHRRDLEWSGELDRFGKKQSLTLLPPDERPVMKWNANPFVVDGGADGRAEDDGAAFLLPYWLGRHHRFLDGE
jgi:hypothetical protein